MLEVQGRLLFTGDAQEPAGGEVVTRQVARAKLREERRAREREDTIITEREPLHPKILEGWERVDLCEGVGDRFTSERACVDHIQDAKGWERMGEVEV